MSCTSECPVGGNSAARQNTKNAGDRCDDCDRSGAASEPRVVTVTSAPLNETFNDGKNERADLLAQMHAESRTEVKAEIMINSGTISTPNSRRTEAPTATPSSSAPPEDSSLTATNKHAPASVCWQEVSYRADTSQGLGLAMDTFNHEVQEVQEGSQADRLGIVPRSLLLSLNKRPITKHQSLRELWLDACGEEATLVVRKPVGAKVAVQQEPKSSTNGSALTKRKRHTQEVDDRKHKEDSASRYRGYSKRKNKWRAYFKIDGSQFSAGEYHLEEEASYAAQAARKFLRNSSPGTRSDKEFAAAARQAARAAVQEMTKEPGSMNAIVVAIRKETNDGEESDVSESTMSSDQEWVPDGASIRRKKVKSGVRPRTAVANHKNGNEAAKGTSRGGYWYCSDKKTRPWQAYFYINRRCSSAGQYDTEELASRASKIAQKLLQQHIQSSNGAVKTDKEIADAVRKATVEAVQTMIETAVPANADRSVKQEADYDTDECSATADSTEDINRECDRDNSRGTDSSSFQPLSKPEPRDLPVLVPKDEASNAVVSVVDYSLLEEMDTSISVLENVKSISLSKDKVVGSRTYAEWVNGECFWGIITHKKQFKASGRGQYKYDVLFDDGDFKAGLEGDQILTVPQYRRFYYDSKDPTKSEPPPVPPHLRGLPINGDDRASASDHSDAQVGLTPEELYTWRCKSCLFCQKADCGRCATCIRNQECADDGVEVCLQNMCCGINFDRKAQPAPGFPDTWKFAFAPPVKNATSGDSPLDWLYLVTPSGRTYRSLEAASAKNHQGKALSKCPRLAEVFHNYVGVPYEPGLTSTTKNNSISIVETVSQDSVSQDSTNLEPKRKRQKVDGNSAIAASSSVVVPAFTPSELYKRGCKECLLCRKEDCSRCATCIRNKNRDGQDGVEVCLRKMCCNIEVQSKAQKAVGFPDGWRFVFEVAKKDYSRRAEYPVIEGLVLLHPRNGRRYHAVERAVSHNPRMFKGYPDVIKDFYAHVGATYSETDLHYELVGRGVCQEWTDVEGRNQVVYGVVVAGCEKDPRDTDNLRATVEYNEESRTDTNDLPSVIKSDVPKSQTIPYSLALGACASYAESMYRHDIAAVPEIANLPLAWRWLVPQRRREELLDTGLGVQLPRLTLTLHGFRLVFTVRESTIPNAGYGVFVSATPLVKNGDAGEDFKLNVGEFLDLGVYAPFQMQDRKKECVFFVKNYVHNFKCEEWCFDTVDDDFQFDITDDLTGNVNQLARRHIPSYVNECSSHDIATVRAEHDPSGNVHYLLGVVDGEGLVLPGNGTETEIFINYGPKYEPVRIRKGYSELLPDIKAKKLKEMEKEEEEYLDEIDGFTVDQVASCVEFLLGLFMKDGKLDLYAADKFSHRAGRRAKLVSLLFEERAKGLKDLGEPVPPALLDSAKSLSSLVERMFGKGSLKDKRREEKRIKEESKVVSL